MCLCQSNTGSWTGGSAYCASLKDITSRFFTRTSLDVMWHHFFMENWGELNAHR
nr:MAG TPA: hypothetical protein [Caudoviricetes sp.]